MTIFQTCFAYSRNYIPVLTREIFQKFRLFPSLGTFRWQCKQKKGHSKTVKGIWKLLYHLQETIGAFAISLTISILRWFIGFLLDWSASLLAVSFHNRILCLIIYCVTSLSLLLLYCIFVLKLSFRMVTIVSSLGNINNDSHQKQIPFCLIIGSYTSLPSYLKR